LSDLQNNRVGLKPDALTEVRNSDIIEPDAVSDCQTVPLEDENIVEEEDDEEEEEEEVKEASSEGLFPEENVSSEGEKETDVDEETMCAKDRFSISPSHMTFHSMKVRGCSSTSTCGQTSDYLCTSYSSGANTVSTNNMDYLLFPEDFSSILDDLGSGEEDDAFVLDVHQNIHQACPGQSSCWQPILEASGTQEHISEMPCIDTQPELSESRRDILSQETRAVIKVEVQQSETGTARDNGDCGCGIEEVEHVREEVNTKAVWLLPDDEEENNIHRERTGSNCKSEERTATK